LAADFEELGKEMLRQEQAFNIKAGIGSEADVLPDLMQTDPLPPTDAVFNVPQEKLGGSSGYAKVIMINRRQGAIEDKLIPLDRLTIFPPVGGG
jgi:aldehyde:ferredoxin oxidoreductase